VFVGLGLAPVRYDDFFGVNAVSAIMQYVISRSIDLAKVIERLQQFLPSKLRHRPYTAQRS